MKKIKSMEDLKNVYVLVYHDADGIKFMEAAGSEKEVEREYDVISRYEDDYGTMTLDEYEDCRASDSTPYWEIVSEYLNLDPKFIVEHIDKITEHVFNNPYYEKWPSSVKLLLESKFKQKGGKTDES